MDAITQIPSSRKVVLAYLKDHPKAIMVLRAAREYAHKIGGKWRAVFVETPAVDKLDDGGHERMLRLLTLASQMGGEVSHLEAETVEAGFRKLLEEEKDTIALSVIGYVKSERGGWRNWYGRRFSPWRRIANLASHYAPVKIVPLTGQNFNRTLWARLQLRHIRLRYFIYALMAVGVASAIAATLQTLLPPALFRINDQNIAMLFMIACAFTAGRYGLLPGLLASVCGYLAVNYFFIQPSHSIMISGITQVIDMSLFLAVTVLISLFASQTHRSAERASRRELSTQVLFSLYRIAASAYTRQQALEKLHRTLSRMLNMEVAFFLPTALNPGRIEAAYPADLELEGDERLAMEDCWREMKTTGFASPTSPCNGWRFEPMLAPGGEVGVMGVRPHKKQQFNLWHGTLLAAIADQTAAVLEHIELERTMESTRIREEREKLRSTLLSSVSHDLKTPLAGIIGALSVHLRLGSKLARARQRDLLETALDEAHRLESFINNILDMTQIESGKINLRREWQDIAGVIGKVVKRMEQRIKKHEILIRPIPSNIEVYMDTMLTEQIFQNLLDNACKYTAPGTAIEITCYTEKERFYVEVRDHGEGLPENKFSTVFDKYARLQKKDSQVAGTGLGLSICKAMIELQEGGITAENHPEGGAVFAFYFPHWRNAKEPEFLSAA